MASLEDVRRSIWHAFTALANGENGQVPKSRLKVLTNNLGQALGQEKAEELLEGSGAEDSLTFTQYFSLVSPKLLTRDPEDTSNGGPAPAPLTSRLTAEVDQICWMLCGAGYHRQTKLLGLSAAHTADLSTEDLFKLWKVFNFLAKVDLDGTEDSLHSATLPLRVDVEEGQRIGSCIRRAIGYDPADIPAVDPGEGDEEREGGKFVADFVDFVSQVCTVAAEKGLAGDVMRQGINSVCDEIVSDVIKKGYLEKFGNQLTNWKRRWFRLSATELQYFTSDLERDMKGTVPVCCNFKPEGMPQRAGSKPFRINLHSSGKRVYELAAVDLRTRNEWVTALQKAADYSGQDGSYQKSELMVRERTRKSRRDKLAEELTGKSLMRKQLQSRDEQLERELKGRQEDKSLLELKEQELDAERLARTGVEARLAAEEAALEAERLRLRELEEIRALLEKLLAEERQAKRDEEIVRGLQSRLLLEETEKREELECLRAEQDRLLQAEREEKEGLQRQRQEQATLLDHTQKQLNTLALERQSADEKIKEVEEKMRLAEVERHKMEERLRLREMSTSNALRHPRQTPDPDPLVSHRGKGAFVDADFVKREALQRDEGDQGPLPEGGD